MACPLDSFSCSSDTCLSWEYVCDGIRQCPNGEDEIICGTCIKNQITCLDGSRMSCELSCTLLGFIPCSKYRNRITCKLQYPNLIGSPYKKRISEDSGNIFLNSNLYLILGSIATVLLIAVILVFLANCIRQKSNNLIHNKKFVRMTRKKTSPVKNVFKEVSRLPKPYPQTQISVKQSSLLNEQNTNEYYDTHNYHEIGNIINNSITDSNRKLDNLILESINKNDNTGHCSQDDYYQIEMIPPSYANSHVFKSVSDNETERINLNNSSVKTNFFKSRLLFL